MPIFLFYSLSLPFFCMYTLVSTINFFSLFGPVMCPVLFVCSPGSGSAMPIRMFLFIYANCTCYYSSNFGSMFVLPNHVILLVQDGSGHRLPHEALCFSLCRCDITTPEFATRLGHQAWAPMLSSWLFYILWTVPQGSTLTDPSITLCSLLGLCSQWPPLPKFSNPTLSGFYCLPEAYPYPGPRHICPVCDKTVGDSSAALQCDRCDQWLHQKCELLSLRTNCNLSKSESWYHGACQQPPFNDTIFELCVQFSAPSIAPSPNGPASCGINKFIAVWYNSCCSVSNKIADFQVPSHSPTSNTIVPLSKT